MMTWSDIIALGGMGLFMSGAGLGAAWWLVSAINELRTAIAVIETVLRIRDEDGAPRPVALRRIMGRRDFGNM